MPPPPLPGILSKAVYPARLWVATIPSQPERERERDRPATGSIRAAPLVLTHRAADHVSRRDTPIIQFAPTPVCGLGGPGRVKYK